MNIDRYRALREESEGLYREKASKFLAWAFPIADEEAFRARLDAIAREHHASRHVCYAWVLDANGQRTRSNDAGEPAGTAGKPILRQIQALGITHSAVVVVRYFGGTLLGKAGLVHAYAEAAREALSHNTVIEHVILGELLVRCSYAQLEDVRSEVLKAGGTLRDAIYGERCELRAALPLSLITTCTEKWVRAGLSVERVQVK
jgi:uncharacterized YigZ family protein